MNVIPSISPVKGKPITVLSIVRYNHHQLTKSHCGFNYIMAHIGTIDDFKAGLIPFIRRKQRWGALSSYAQLLAMDALK